MSIRHHVAAHSKGKKLVRHKAKALHKKRAKTSRPRKKKH